MKTKKKVAWGKVLFWFVLLSLILSVVYAVLNAIFAPTERVDGEPFTKVKADYMLMVLQCALGSVALFIPSFVERKWKFEVPNYMYIMYIIFLYFAIYLGEVRDFFYIFANFDTILHLFSSIMLGALGFSIIEYLNKSNKVPVGLSPGAIAVFSFCFAVTIGVFWEVYEFVFDGILGLNMQKFMLEDGTQLIGRIALTDTMHDLMIDSFGALIVCVIGYIIMRIRLQKEPEPPFYKKLQGMITEKEASPAEKKKVK